MNDVGREPPRYRCHKEVYALKISHIEPMENPDPTGATDATRGAFIVPEEPGYGPIEVSGDFMIKHRPHAGGYLVMYEDGYRSFSPAAAFEKGYTRIN